MRKLLLSLLILMLFSLASVFNVAADEIVVTSTANFETRRMEMEPGDLADIEVFAKSVGDLLANFRVLLIRVSDNRLLQVELTDRFGVATFSRLGPGKYSVIFEVPEELRGVTTTGLGDFRVKLSEFSEDENVEEKVPERLEIQE